jgi:uncharacterized protein (TIGR02145 family)
MPTKITARKKILTALVLLFALSIAALVATNNIPHPKYSWKSGTTTVTLSEDGTFRVKARGWFSVRRSIDAQVLMFSTWWTRDLDITVGSGKMDNYYCPERRREDTPRRFDFDDFLARERWLSWDEVPPWYNRDGRKVSRLVVMDRVKHIGVGTFAQLNGLKSVTIPNSVTSIGYGAFMYCDGLRSIDVSYGNPVYSSVDGVLLNKAKDTIILYPRGKQGAFTIPNTVANIYSDLFSGCPGLTSINVNDDNPRYSSVDGVLFNKAKDTLILCPRGKQGAFDIPNGVTVIESEAFRGTRLTSVTIPNSVISIGGYAFYMCDDLKSVTIPSSVTKLGNGVFTFCKGLTSIVSLNPDPPDNIDDRTFGGLPNKTCLYVPENSIGWYRGAIRRTTLSDEFRFKDLRLDPSKILPLTTAAIAGAFAAETAFGTFTDGRDGQTYRTVKIGKQTWMAENLNYLTESGSWCYNDSASYCKQYGRLYDWKTATTICPIGWKLPDTTDWNKLAQTVGGKRNQYCGEDCFVFWVNAGNKLKSKSGWIEYYNINGNGTDDYGFSALPGGFRYSVDSFRHAGDRGFWWTATEYSDSNAYYRLMLYDYNSVDEFNFFKRYGLSVRCVADTP